MWSKEICSSCLAERMWKWVYPQLNLWCPCNSHPNSRAILPRTRKRYWNAHGQPWHTRHTDGTWLCIILPRQNNRQYCTRKQKWEGEEGGREGGRVRKGRNRWIEKYNRGFKNEYGYGRLIFNKDTTDTCLEKNLFNERCWQNWTSTCED